MTSACRIRLAAALSAVATLLAPAMARAQADSLPADSALARPANAGSRTVIRGSSLRLLLTDDPQHALGLVPGVVMRQGESGLARAGVLSLRGGAPGGASVYIDGAPVRFLRLGTAGVRLATVSVAEVAVTTGVPDLGLPDLRDGIIEYETQAGGRTLTGSLRAGTDQAFPGVGFNRFDGFVGGPLPGMTGVTFSVGGTVMGQRSHYVGIGSEHVPSYVPAGIDTTVTIVNGENTRDVVLPSYVDQRAYDWGTDFRGHAKLQFTAASGARLSVTGVATEVQERFFPGMLALAPSLYGGARAGARLVVANWRQPLVMLGRGPLSLRLTASLGSNETAAGLLEAESQIASRDPALGITLETLRFTGVDSLPMPVTDQLIRNIRTNSGWRVPFLNRDDLRNVQSSRGNPYGMETSWPQGNLDGVISVSAEKRADVRVALDWMAGANHVTLGGDVSQAEVSSYTSNLLRQSFMDVYRSNPDRAGVYVTDRFEHGDLRADIALRFDHFGSVGLFPTTPGRIYTNPAFNRLAAITTDTGYTNSLARVMTPGKARDAVSLRAAAQHDLGPRTTVRAVFGRWVEPPPLGLVLLGSNSDLDFTNTNDRFGRDVDYGYAALAEIGARHDIRRGLVADIVVYRQARPVYGFTTQRFDDPANPGDVANVNALTKAGDVAAVGGDVALDWHLGSWFVSRVAYGLRLSQRVPSSSESGTFDTHSIMMVAVAQVPGRPFRGVEASVVLRLTSGLPYTRVSPTGGTGVLAVRTDFGLIDEAAALSSSRLPWTRNLDLRVTRSVKLGAQDFIMFAEFRNLLNFKNILNLFAETGDVENAYFRAQRLNVEFGSLQAEAASNSRLLANGDIDLVPNCDSWTQAGGPNGAVVNCVALRRAEARFGNGDRLYSRAERETALNAFFNAFYGPQTFYGAGRSVRLGGEIRW